MVSDVCSVLHISVVLRYLEVFAKKMTFIKDKLFPVNEIFSQMLVLQRSPTSSTFYGSLLTKNYKIQTFPSSFTSSQLVVHCSFTEGSLTTKNTASGPRCYAQQTLDHHKFVRCNSEGYCSKVID